MRASGARLSMTPLQMATASSSVPKSVMNTMMGADSFAGTSAAIAGRSSAPHNTHTAKAEAGISFVDK
jgi:hypothetical protein